MTRETRLSTVSIAHNSAQPHTAQGNLETIQRLLDKAGSIESDIVCLPELCGMMGLREKPLEEQAQDVPEGLIAQAMIEKAREYEMYVVAPILQKVEHKFFNCAFLLDRSGEVAGRYAKTHLTEHERDRGITPGDSFPVMETDFGKIGILICYDLNFPETARILSVKGAEIIFWPTMWSGPTDYFCEVVPRVRAMENISYFVSSNYVPIELEGKWRNSYIISWNGCILASTGPREGLASALVDLDEKKLMQGTIENLLGNHRRPHIYDEILREWRKK